MAFVPRGGPCPTLDRMTDRERARFDALVEELLGNLPPKLRALLDEVPLVVEDRPDNTLASELYDELAQGRGETLEEFAATLCGLHTGIALTERSVEHSGVLPEEVRIFREGIVALAGGWSPAPDETDQDVDDAVYEEIAITVLHELGHHFGLDEEDLEKLGYD